MSNLDDKKCKIEVFVKPNSTEILKTFNSISELEQWIEHDKHPTLDIDADQVAINDQVLLGWDELYEFI